MTKLLFRKDAYQADAEATVIAHTPPVPLLHDMRRVAPANGAHV